MKKIKLRKMKKPPNPMAKALRDPFFCTKIVPTPAQKDKKRDAWDRKAKHKVKKEE